MKFKLVEKLDSIEEGFEEFAYNKRADYDRLNTDDDYYNALWDQYETELELQREREEYDEV